MARALAALAFTSAAAAASAGPGHAAAPAGTQGSGLAVQRQVIAGGGGSSSGGPFAITGTLGQVDADPLAPATGGLFAISGGFWPGLAPAVVEPVFANGFEGP